MDTLQEEEGNNSTYQLGSIWSKIKSEIVEGDYIERSCDVIYQSVKREDDLVNKQKFFSELEDGGILHDDPRITDMKVSMEDVEECIDRQTFIRCIRKNLTVAGYAITKSNIIPNFRQFSNNIRKIYTVVAGNNKGNLASYNPELTMQNPDYFGVSVCTIDGQRLNIGDTNAEFTIQACSQPISYCLAMEEHGGETVHEYVGREASGDNCQALKLNGAGLPHNPLINSGAIMMMALIKSHLKPAARFRYIVNNWTTLTGGLPLGYSNPIFLAERDTGDRKFALAHFMKGNNLFPPGTDIADVLECFFQVCSITINSNYLSIVAASLANGGVCPLTGMKVFSPETVNSCLSIMYSSGMYGYSGEFAYNVGLPAKSGISGCIFVVIPNVMGICAFSPRVDTHGNSVRGIEFLSQFTKTFSFHLFDNIESSGKQDPTQGKNCEDLAVEKIIKYCSLGDIGALQRLGCNGRELVNADYDKRTPLHLAASNGHLSVVQYLLQHIGAEHVNPVDRWRGTPYDDALRENHYNVAFHLKSIGGKCGKDLYEGVI